MKHIFFIIVLVFSALFCNAEELNEGLAEGEKIVLHVGILDPYRTLGTDKEGSCARSFCQY